MKWNPPSQRVRQTSKIEFNPFALGLSKGFEHLEIPALPRKGGNDRMGSLNPKACFLSLLRKQESRKEQARLKLSPYVLRCLS